jgi:hypothetical protein
MPVPTTLGIQSFRQDGKIRSAAATMLVLEVSLFQAGWTKIRETETRTYLEKDGERYVLELIEEPE